MLFKNKPDKSSRLYDKYYSLLPELSQPKTDNSLLRIIFIGEFNSGKSSLVNKLLESEFAPVGVFQTTATINRIKYSAIPQFRVIDHKDNIILKDGDLSKLKSFNADEGLFENVKWIEIDSPLMNPDLEFIDTPGFNDPNPSRDSIFLSIAPTADIIIFLGDANIALKSSELPFINKFFLSYLNRIIFVFNHCDTLSSLKRLKTVQADVVKKLIGVLDDAGKIFAKYECNDVSKSIKSIKINDQIYFTSAILQNNSKSLQIEKNLNIYLNEEYDRLKNCLSHIAKEKQTILNETAIRKLIILLQDKRAMLDSLIADISSSKQHQSNLQTSIVQRIEKQQNTFEELVKGIASLPGKVKTSIDQSLDSSLEQLDTSLRSYGDDWGGAPMQQVYSQELQAAIERMVSSARSIVSQEIGKSLDIDLANINQSSDKYVISIPSNFSRSINIQTGSMEIQAKAGLMGEGAFIIGSILGGPLIGMIAAGVSGYWAMTQQKGVYHKQQADLEEKYRGAVEHARELLQEAEESLIQTLQKSLLTFEKDIIKGTESMEWEIIELSEYSKDASEGAEDELRNRVVKLNLAIQDCTLQMLS